jgi:hypothetical protein
MNDSSKTCPWVFIILVGILSFVFYYFTAFRTFTWWDSSDYTLAAATLGITGPPGSSLLTIIGWIVSKIPFAHTIAFRLNILSAILSSVTISLLSFIAFKVIREDKIPNIALLFVIITGELIFAFSRTFWDYARHFSPYTLTALFTAFISLALLTWWKRADNKQSWTWIFLIFLLFGLDFSVHRTNILLLPGVFLWISLRKVEVYKSYKTWLALIIGFLIGFSFQLILIPMALRNPFLNIGNPNTFSRLWDYITLKLYGGGWLINLLPRKAPFFKVQIIDYLKMFMSNFSFLPILFGIIGMVRHFYTDWKKALGFLIFFLLASIGAVIYFNTSADYFRTMDRHYIPSFIFFAFWVCYGIATLLYLAMKLRNILKPIAMVVVVLISIYVPISYLVSNYYIMDASLNYFAEDYARNMLIVLPEHAIILTNGDNDTFPLWCLQYSENFRKDITVLNIPLINTNWFIKEVMRRDSLFPIKLSESEIDNLKVIKWRDSTIVIPINKNADLGLLSNSLAQDTILIKISPTMGGAYLLIQDQIVLDILKNNNWQRPIYFATTVDSRNIPWLQSYFCLEGLSNRIVPTKSFSVNIDKMKENLFHRYLYQGFADKRVYVDGVTQNMALNYLSAFMALAQSEKESGNKTDCLATIDYMEKVIPIEQLKLSSGITSQIFEAIKQLRSE